MESEETKKENPAPQTASGTPSESSELKEQFRMQLANLAGVKVQAEAELEESKKFRSESATRQNEILEGQKVHRAEHARIESILRVVVGSPKEKLMEQLALGPMDVTYQGIDGKKKLVLEKLEWPK